MNEKKYFHRAYILSLENRRVFLSDHVREYISFQFQSLLVHNSVFVISVMIGFILSTVLGSLVLLPLLKQLWRELRGGFSLVRTCLHTHTEMGLGWRIPTLRKELSPAYSA